MGYAFVAQEFDEDDDEDLDEDLDIEVVSESRVRCVGRLSSRSEAAAK